MNIVIAKPLFHEGLNGFMANKEILYLKWEKLLMN